MPDKIRIMLADDHPVVVDGLGMMLETQPDFEVVGTAGNGAELLERIADLAPDVLLLDIEMPELDGIEALQRLTQTAPDVRVLVFTAYNTDDHIVQAVKAGVKGFLLKGTPRNEIFQAIRSVYQGRSLLQPVVVARLMDRLDQTVEHLTAREEEVLNLVGRGSTNKEIAQSLVISERTVKFHISSILSKLGASNRTEAVTIAIQRGLLDIVG